MSFTPQHTKAFKIAVLAILLMSGGPFMNAQKLIMPERWNWALTSVRPVFNPDTLTIRILGDIMMHQQQIEEAETEDGTYDFSSYFRFIEDEIRDADISVANMEFTLAGEPYTGYPCFSAPDSFAGYLAECGFDIFLSANNHIFDKGTKGTERTLEIYRRLEDRYGIRFTGIAGNEDEMDAGTPLLIRRKGILLAMLNFTYGTNMGLGAAWPKTNYIGEKARMGKAFSKAEESDADRIIAFPHWGPEYRLHHSETQEKDAGWMAANGADWIIGAHPHVVQDSSDLNGTTIVYSLGNAVSNMSAENTRIGLMATIRIIREENGDLRDLPLELEYLWCSRPGGYGSSYTVIPVKEFMDRKDEWKNPADFEKMLETYERVKRETDIND